MTEQQINFVGSTRRNLYPFNTPENKKQTKNMVNKISGWVNKLEVNESNEEIVNFRATLNKLQFILRKLYTVEVIFKK
jgi:hypothetical protein